MKLIVKCLALAGAFFVSATKYTPTAKVTADISVKVEFFENSYQSTDVYRQIFTSSENFYKEVNQIDISRSGSVEVEGIGGASSAFTFSKMNEAQTYDKTVDQLTTQNKLTYQEGFTQVLRVITTTININGESIVEVTKDYVGTAGGLTWTERNNMAVDYINTNIKCNSCPNITRNIFHYQQEYSACNEGDILYKGRCNTQIRINLQGKDLHGYDGGFYPSPEPYLKIDVDGSRIYTGRKNSRSNNKNPSLTYSTSVNRIRSSLNVELWDDDTEGSHDLMCRHYFDMDDVRSNLLKYGKNAKTDLYCMQGGSAYVTLYLE